MLKLNTRLREIFLQIPDGTNLLADIGCDHGKLLISALLSNKCKKAIGADISRLSLDKAENFAKKFLLEDRAEFIESDGFSQIKKDVDVAVIAGMGGNEIVNILKQKHHVDTYILCPHQDAHIVREYMNNIGLFAKKDFIIKDNDKFYPIIVTEKIGEKYSNEEIFLGKNFPQKNEYIEKNDRRFLYLENIINKNNYEKFSIEITEEYEVLKKWQQSRR